MKNLPPMTPEEFKEHLALYRACSQAIFDQAQAIDLFALQDFSDQLRLVSETLKFICESQGRVVDGQLRIEKLLREIADPDGDEPWKESLQDDDP